MLARTFLTPEQLKISPKAHRALVLCLNAMERGELTHVDVSNPTFVEESGTNFTGHFNMAEWNAERSCGTVACIGGTAELLGEMDFFEETGANFALENLFYPVLHNTSLNDITVEQAHEALVNFLTTGSARWQEVLKEG